MLRKSRTYIKGAFNNPQKEATKKKHVGNCWWKEPLDLREEMKRSLRNSSLNT